MLEFEQGGQEGRMEGRMEGRHLTVNTTVRGTIPERQFLRRISSSKLAPFLVCCADLAKR